MVTQRLQENGWGTKVPGNNLFNIKGKSSAGSITLVTKEEDANGNSTVTKANFRKYDSFESSVQDYINVLSENFPDAYEALMNGGDIDDFVNGLDNGTNGKYATDADYKEQLKKLYKQVSEEYTKVEEVNQ